MDIWPITMVVVLASTLAIGSLSLLSGQCHCSEEKFCERIKDTTKKEVCGDFSLMLFVSWDI
jgi:hypothetical protein